MVFFFFLLNCIQNDKYQIVVRLCYKSIPILFYWRKKTQKIKTGIQIYKFDESDSTRI